MDLTQAARRVFARHALLIAACVVMGALGGFLKATSGPDLYTASARVILSPQGPGSAEVVTAVADGARAMVTSRGLLARVLDDIGAERNPAVLAKESIVLENLGSSSVLQLDVTDLDPTVASALANALVHELVTRWLDTSGGNVGRSIDVLEQRIDLINKDVASLDARIAVLNIRLAGRNDGSTSQRLRASREALIPVRAALVQQRLLFQSEISRVLIEAANEPVPQVIDAAVSPREADPSRAVPFAGLGALLGFLIGAAAAAVLETLSPTLVGADAIADALDAPILARLGTGEVAPEDLERLGLQMHLAATRARTNTVELVSVRGRADESTLRQVAEGIDGDQNGGKSPHHRLVVHPFGIERSSPGSRQNGHATSLVAVLPSVIRSSQLREIRDLQGVTAWPLIGVITYGR
jgi:uncharacterized protein involved in exopolysaccharide biosynthesis